MNDQRLQQLWDRITITDVVNLVLIGTDGRDWTAVRSSFARDVRLDYTSLNGGDAATMDADAMVAMWQGVLPGFVATQHLVGNHRIMLDGDRATCTAYVHATHYLPTQFGSPLWKVAGVYTFELVRVEPRWQITAMTFTATWGEGNQSLPTLAAQRAGHPS